MKLCPKCRSFYDDEFLKFCLKDGTPLATVTQNNQFWKEGLNKISETRKIELSELRKQYLKRIFSVLVMTVLVIMVITVITLWSWIYLNKKPKNVVTNDAQPPPTEVIPTQSPEFILAGLETPSPTPMSKPIPTPSPTPSTTQSPDETSTSKPAQTKSPKIETSPSISPPPPTPCVARQEEAIIRASYAASFKTKINSEKQEFYSTKDSKEINGVELSINPNDLKISVSSDCRNASAIYPYYWMIYRKGGNNQKIDRKRNFSCEKSTIWKCN